MAGDVLMSRQLNQTQILDFPWAISVQGGRVVSLREEKNANQTDLLLTYQSFQATNPSKITLHNGQLEETLHGTFCQHRLQFHNIAWYKSVPDLPKLGTSQTESKLPLIGRVMHWYHPDYAYPFFLLHTELDNLLFFAERCSAMPVTKAAETAVFRCSSLAGPALAS